MLKNKNLVYSTDVGRVCPDCGKAKAECNCKVQTAAAPSDGIVRLQRQVKGRAGKPIVIISGLALDAQALKKLAKKLKSTCGVGGTTEGNDILIQGDKRDLIKTTLESQGFKVKLSGG
ncbi:MAG: translation initiation factor 1 [Candidatus Azotimanducaceae bacterium]|jgi:translation initiation factor 1